MSNKTRPELSKKNPYWLERHRYYELKHFCMQYPLWVKERAAIDGLVTTKYGASLYSPDPSSSDPTAKAADVRLFYTNRIEMVEEAARETDPVIGSYILAGVTCGVSYEALNARFTVPCGKDMYYELYRKFFWLLSRKRQ